MRIAMPHSKGYAMTPQEVDLVQRTWRLVMPVGDIAAELFYGKLFSLDPSLRLLFKSGLKDQGRNLIAMMSVAVHNLGKPDKILRALGAANGIRQNHRRNPRALREPIARSRIVVCGAHHSLGRIAREPRHYETVSVALLWMLEKCLGEAFTPEVKGAWAAAYELLAAEMREAACVS